MGVKLLPILLFGLLSITPALADIQTTSPRFDKTVYYQGDDGSVQITIVNNYSSFQITNFVQSRPLMSPKHALVA